MLIIRRQQMKILDDYVRRTFIERMVAHVERFFPASIREMDAADLRKTIRKEIEHAGRHGFVAQRDVCKFIDIVFALGRDFDENPEHVWAREILDEPEGADAPERMKRLTEAAISHLNRENSDVQ
jgi:hypothetical protein